MLWEAFDANKNGMLSLAELDGGLQNHLNGKTKSSDVYKRFKPS